ncbi:Uncharacterised protein [Acinetobacter haemolyticus]|nr:Uncharacterised protein [Acinetobacter haemolyticus]
MAQLGALCISNLCATKPLISITGSFLLVFLGSGFTFENFLIWSITAILFYFILFFIIKNAARSLKHLSEKSEQIFGLYGFKDPKEVFLLPSRYLSEKDHLMLEAVFEYRKVIEEDPYPENYIEQKERNV